MHLRDNIWWIKIRESMWFVPTLLVCVGLVLAVVTIYLDNNYSSWIARGLSVGFGGGADAARAILETIAGAIATVVGVVFSILLVVLQLAAGNYSPRVLTTFRRDRGQQIVLGVYLGTFVYALLVLREVRDATDVGPELIPQLSMLVALVLALGCLGLLVYLVHHISEILRVSDIARRIYEELVEVSDQLYPDELGEAFDPERDDAEIIEGFGAWPGETLSVRCTKSGYLRRVDVERLTELLCAPVHAARIHTRVGAFVLERGPLIELYLEGEVPAEERERLGKAARKCFIKGPRPNATQDAERSIRQLVDVALRALSPAVNEPTTAEEIMVRLGDWLGKIAQAPLPSSVRRIHGRMLIAPRASFDEFVADCFDQIRAAGATHAHVLHSLLSLIESILDTDPRPEYRLPLRRQVQGIERAATERNYADPVVRRALADHARAVLERMDSDS